MIESLKDTITDKSTSRKKMDWLTEHLPMLLSAFVAVSSALIAVVKLFTESSTSTRRIKRLADLADVYTKLPDGLEAKGSIGDTLTTEANRMKERTERKVNAANIAAALIIAVIGGAMTFGLASWATSSPSALWTVVAWVLFVIVAFFTLALAVAGLALMYSHDSETEEN